MRTRDALPGAVRQTIWVPMQLSTSSTKAADDAHVVLDALRRIVQVLRESSRAAEQELGVTGAQLFVLTTLREAEPLSVNELAERTRTHQSTVSVVVKRLALAGLVRRDASDLDARRVVLSLTARGRALLARSPGTAQERLVASVEAMPRSERAALASSLGRVASAMADGEGAPPMFFEDGPRAKPKKGGRRRGA